MDEIQITEPVAIRFYAPGGRGGYGFRSTRWHRLVARSATVDRTSCGEQAPGWRTSVKEMPLSPRQQGDFALCPKCWG